MSDTGALVYVVDDDASAREGVAALIRSPGWRHDLCVSGGVPGCPATQDTKLFGPGCESSRGKRTRPAAGAGQIESAGSRSYPDRPRRHPDDRARAQNRCGELDETFDDDDPLNRSTSA